MSSQTFGKLLMTLALAVFTFLPPLADLATDTHVFHPDWPPHARLHTVWLLGLTSSIGLVALYLLWSHTINSSSGENLAGIIGTSVYGSFFLSVMTAQLYGGSVTDHEGGITQSIIGLNLNVFTFGIASIALLVGWRLCKRSRN